MEKVFKFLLGLVLFLLIVYLISIPFGVSKKWYISVGIFVGGYIVNESLKKKKR